MKNQVINISIAKLSDTKNIMKFMNDVLKKEHILSRDKKLFLHEFQNKENLNIVIAKNNHNDILGIFGFMYYNNRDLPDIAGSLWKVDPKVKEPLLGIKLRNYFKKHIKHNFFAAPGANIGTKPIYKVLKMDWNIMEHYYIANDKLTQFHIAKNPLINKIEIASTDTKITKIDNTDMIKEFDFSCNGKVVPKKDINYIENKFFKHPIRKYDTYILEYDNKIKNIFICRTVETLQSSIYRMVDFYGVLDYLEDITQFLYTYITKHNHEYVDFIQFGLDDRLLQKAGFNKLDFNSESTVIPNLFEPFVQNNSPVYCVSDKTDLEFRQFKADGDQDRPNL